MAVARKKMRVRDWRGAVIAARLKIGGFSAMTIRARPGVSLLYSATEDAEF
jgi:hypothetical protein